MSGGNKRVRGMVDYSVDNRTEGVHSVSGSGGVRALVRVAHVSCSMSERLNESHLFDWIV